VRRTRLTLTALATAAALTLAACGGGDSGGEEEPDAPAAAEAPAEPDFWPLTGLEVPDGGSADKKHPVMVVKIDNTASAAPQRGLDAADLVVEELVEGGLTRLAVLFYEQLPDVVGPVRSMRASDIGIVSPVDASVVTSGAASQTIARVREAGIEFFPEGSAGVYRDTARSAPYNVFADLGAVAKAAGGPAGTPSDYFEFGDPADLPKGQPARSLQAVFSGGHTTAFRFEGGTYRPQSGYAADGEGFEADTVLVLTVPVGDAGYLDPAGNPVPETMFEGTGPAVLAHDGRVVRGTWSKPSLDGRLTLRTQAGPLPIPPGRTWVALVPRDGGSVGFSR